MNIKEERYSKINKTLRTKLEEASEVSWYQDIRAFINSFIKEKLRKQIREVNDEVKRLIKKHNNETDQVR